MPDSDSPPKRNVRASGPSLLRTVVLYRRRGDGGGHLGLVFLQLRPVEAPVLPRHAFPDARRRGRATQKQRREPVAGSDVGQRQSRTQGVSAGAHPRPENDEGRARAGRPSHRLGRPGRAGVHGDAGELRRSGPRRRVRRHVVWQRERTSPRIGSLTIVRFEDRRRELVAVFAAVEHSDDASFRWTTRTA